MVIRTKTYASLVSTYLYPCIIKLRRKSHKLSQKSLFGRQRNLRHTFLYSELHCLPRGDSRTLCVNARIRLLATHSLAYLIYKYSIFNTDTFFPVGKERLKYLIGTNFRGHLISRKKGRHISRVFIFAIWVQNYFLPELIFREIISIILLLFYTSYCWKSSTHNKTKW